MFTKKSGAQKRQEWPRVVKVGNSSVKVYQTAHPRTRSGFVYVVAWRTPEGRKRKGFTSEARALNEARVIAEQLNSGLAQSSTMTATEREECVMARAFAREKGLPLISAMREWQSAFELTGGRILDAAKAWSQKHTSPKAAITVDEAVSLYIAAQRERGVKTHLGAERTLCTDHSTAEQPSFRSRFGACKLAEISTDALAQWLEGFAHPVTRNTRRKHIVALWRWCRRRGHLPVDATTVAERTDTAQEDTRQIGVVSADALRAVFDLIAREHPHYVPTLALSAFCGMRSFEVHGQRWDDFDFERKFLRVTNAKPNTPARRQVPLCETALAWLAAYRQNQGPVCQNLGIYQIRKICRKAGIDLAENGFRHTWISARVEITGDIPRTALESGTSVKMIHRHYRDLLRPEEAAAWFAVTPQSVSS